jgi:choice-of-anchor B domain-containing protein
MKKNFLLAVAILTLCSLQAQPNFNMTLLAHWDDPTLPVASPGNLNLQYSGCWGITVNNHEIAVLGGAAHLLFFDVTTPTQPQLIGKFAGSATTVWREIKSYKDRIYAVSDATTEGLMIFDMSEAPDTVRRTYWSNQFFERAHTITLDTVSGRIYLNGGSAGDGIIVLDVSQDPDQPTLLGHPNIPGGYVHDSYVRGDTLYCSSGYEGYYIFDFKDPNDPKLLANVGTQGYNHNSWINKEGTYAYYTEEIPKGQPVRIVDLQQLTAAPVGEIEVVGGFLDNLLFPNEPNKLAIPHNVYIRDTILFNSQYEDGLLAYSISDPLNPVLIGHYDTHSQNSIYNGYYGNWGNYPWFPSGTIVAGDMQNGLYLLRLNSLSSGSQTPNHLLAATITPNPASDFVQIKVNDAAAAAGWHYRVCNAAGQVVATQNSLSEQQHQFPTTAFPRGLYMVEVFSENGQRMTEKVVLQ